MQIICDIHAWMGVYGLVIDHLQAGTTDTNDRFKIEQLAEGEHSLTIWFERIGYSEKAFKIAVNKDKRVELDSCEVSLDRFKIRDNGLQK